MKTGLIWGGGSIALIAVGFFLRGPIAPIQIKAEPLYPPAGQTADAAFVITNTLVSAWLSIIVLLLVVALVIGFRGGRLKLVPTGWQNALEAVFEVFLNLCEGVAGRENGRRFFPLVMTIFLFIIVSAWLALVPGFATIGYVHESEYGVRFEQAGPVALILPDIFSGAGGVEPAENGEETSDQAGHGEGAESSGLVGEIVPFLRSANTDLNTPLALALVAVFMVQWWGIRAQGFFGYGSKFFPLRNLKRGKIVIGFIDLGIGFIELVGEVARILSFTFRLFGNMFAGEVLLVVITFLLPLVVAVPFYGLETFVGFVQALVFAMLTLVFATGAITSHGDHEEEHDSQKQNTAAATAE